MECKGTQRRETILVVVGILRLRLKLVFHQSQYSETETEQIIVSMLRPDWNIVSHIIKTNAPKAQTKTQDTKH